MTSKLVSDLVRYVVARAGDEEVKLGKTKLTKLLYLVDVENCRRHGQALTGLKWRFYYYGPYAFELDEVLAGMPDDFDESRQMLASGRRFYEYSNQVPLDAIEAQVDSTIGTGKRALVDKVLGAWLVEDLRTLLDYVYFETEPMIHAERGDVLDLTTVERRVQKRRIIQAVAAPAEFAELRQRLAVARQSRTKRMPRRVAEAAHGPAYWAALRTMDADG